MCLSSGDLFIFHVTVIHFVPIYIIYIYIYIYRPCGKESTEVRITQNKGKESENSYQKLSSRWTGTWTHTRKQNQNILTDTAFLLNQKRANVCEHRTRIASLEFCVTILVCSHTFALFWLRRRAVSVEIFRFCFRVYVRVPVHHELFNFREELSFSFPLFCVICIYKLV